MPRNARPPLLPRLAALAGLLAAPVLALAVSIGDMVPKSYLNQPFRAEIPVTSLQPGDLENLKPQLADDETFERFGLERSSFLLSLDFELIEGRGEGSGTILVSSPEIAREPFFTFLLELKGQRERLIREYTVLLDPQTADRPAPAPQPAVSEVAPYVEEEEQAPVPAAEPPADAVAVPEPQIYESTTPIVTPREKPQVSAVVYENQPVIEPGRYGPVRAGETLWGIAAAVRPSDRVTMNQVMWALFSYNESQFAGSLNLLNKGALLQVPSEQAMLDVSPAEADALVASASQAPAPAEPEQIAVEDAPAEPVAELEPVMPEPTAEPAPLPAEPEEELALVEPDEEVALEELPVEEDLEPLPEEEELEPLPQDEELEPLPGEEVADAEAGYDDLPPLPGDEEEFPADEPLEDLPVEGEVAEADVPEPEAAQPLEPEPLQPLQPAPEEEGGMLIWLLAGAGVLLLGGGALFLARRGKQGQTAPVAGAAAPAAATATADFEDTQEVEEEAEPEITATQDISEPEPAPAPPEPRAEEEDLGATAQFEAPLTAEQAPPAEDTAAEEGLAELELPEGEEIDEAEGTLDLGSDTVSLELNEDPLSEADFQLAYGLYDEAALLLEKAIESDPDRVELHEKLAETYFAASNADKFRQTAQALKSKRPGEDVWQRIAIMGQQLCPEDDLFSMDMDEGEAGAVDLDMGFEEPQDSGAKAAAPEDDHSLDFTYEEPEAPSERPAHDESTTFEADFDDLDLDEAEETVDDTMADIGDLGLEDLESELEGGAGASEDEDLSLALEEPEPEAETPAEQDEELELGDTTAFEAGDTEIHEGPLGAPPETGPAPDTGEEELSLVDEETDFGVDTGIEEPPGELELTDLPEDTDFEVDSGTGTAEGLDLGEETDFDLGEAESSAESTDFDLGDATELGEADTQQATGEETDFDLGGEAGAEEEDATGLELPETTGEETDFDLGVGEETDFDVGGADTEFDLSGETGDEDSGLELPEDTGSDTDFDLSEEISSDDTDFDLTDIGEETDFDLGDEDTGADDLEGLTLQDIESEGTDLDLGEDTGTDDTGDISGGDEPGTKLDLATAYVEMGEADMARSLLEEVIGAGSDEQKAKARELLDKL